MSGDAAKRFENPAQDVIPNNMDENFHKSIIDFTKRFIAMKLSSFRKINKPGKSQTCDVGPFKLYNYKVGE